MPRVNTAFFSASARACRYQPSIVHIHFLWSGDSTRDTRLFQAGFWAEKLAARVPGLRKGSYSDWSLEAVVLMENCSALIRAEATKFFARDGSFNKLTIASPKGTGSLGGTSRPSVWSRTISHTPSTRDATKGTPAAIASTTAIPKPSHNDGNTNRSAARRIAATSGRRPRRL